jgi:hypothetical protein
MSNKTSNIYQFKITLKGITPKIWRRIQVPGIYNFEELHVAIQNAMGWYDCHLHQFEMKTVDSFGLMIGTEECDKLEHKAKIAKYFLFPKDRAIYEYDFGNGWEHEVVLEKILPAVMGTKYPKCISGKRACPPEDCGGVWGYEELLDIIADPKHPEYEERMEWLGKPFNPEEFDPKLVEFDTTKEYEQIRF